MNFLYWCDSTQITSFVRGFLVEGVSALGKYSTGSKLIRFEVSVATLPPMDFDKNPCDVISNPLFSSFMMG